MTPSLRQRLAEAQKGANGSAQLPVASGKQRTTLGRRTATGTNHYEPHCIFARKSCSCSKRTMCERDWRGPKPVGRDECNPDCPDAVPAVRLDTVVTAFNEGDWVRPTVESLVGSVKQAEVEVVLVDDGSSDGSCAFGSALPNVRVLRHEKPVGVGRARNAGWKAARGNVVSFHDAHMEFPEGGLERLARRALQSDGAIVCAISNGLDRDARGRFMHLGNRMWGCDLFYNRTDGLQPKWAHLAKTPPDPWTRSPAIMGAGYVMSRVTAERLEAATGTLWDDVAGRWGFSEEALSVKAFLLGIPIYYAQDVVIRHHYRGGKEGNPVPGAGADRRRNATRCTALLFGRDVWERRWRPWCEKWLRPKVVQEIADEAFATAEAHGTLGRWVRPVEDVFTHLCGKHATVDAPHPEHAWLPSVEAACREIAARKPEGEGAKVLQWRPGESTLLARRLLPKAQIAAVEMPGHRADNWWDICRANGVELVKSKLGASYAALGAELGKGFDLVLVGGEMQEACTRAARPLLARGGRLIANLAADRLQVADEFRRTEKDELAKAHHGDTGRAVCSDQETVASAPTAAPAVAVPPSTGHSPLVTICLLNWKRPQNIPAILDCLVHQAVRPRVVIWNNGPPLLPSVVGRPDVVHVVVESSVNFGCFPRWPMLALADTEFVCSMDDDLMFADDRVLEDAVAACREECPDGIVGLFGWSEVEGKDYRHGRHHNGTTTGMACDIVKGRFMLFRRALLERVPLEIPTLAPFDGLSHREDDVYVSLCVSGGRKDWHRIPARLGHRWRELPQGDASATARPGHWQNRDRTIGAVRHWLAARQLPVASSQ